MSPPEPGSPLPWGSYGFLCSRMLMELLDAWGRVAVDSAACSRYQEVCPRVVRGLEEVRKILEVMIKSGCLDKGYSEIIESINSMIRWVGGDG